MREIVWRKVVKNQSSRHRQCSKRSGHSVVDRKKLKCRKGRDAAKTSNGSMKGTERAGKEGKTARNLFNPGDDNVDPFFISEEKDATRAGGRGKRHNRLRYIFTLRKFEM